MTRIQTVMVTTLLAGVLAAGAVHAQGPGERRGGPLGPGGPFGAGRGAGAGIALRGLDLSDTQREQIRSLTQQRQDEHRQAAERLRTALEAQRKAVETTPVNEGLIRSTTQALAEAQTELALQQARLRTEIVSLLTPEQQERLVKMQAERATRVAERRQRQQERQQQGQQQPAR